jgi:hypothetical protein
MLYVNSADQFHLCSMWGQIRQGLDMGCISAGEGWLTGPLVNVERGFKLPKAVPPLPIGFPNFLCQAME